MCEKMATFNDILEFESTEITVFWDVTPHSYVDEYQLYNGNCFLHLQGITSQKTTLTTRYIDLNIMSYIEDAVLWEKGSLCSVKSVI
jgi:hypothetical protein